MSYKPSPAEQAKIQKMMDVVPGWELKVSPSQDFMRVVEAYIEKTVNGERIATSRYAKHQAEAHEPLACVVFQCVKDAMEYDKIPGEPPYTRTA